MIGSFYFICFFRVYIMSNYLTHGILCILLHRIREWTDAMRGVLGAVPLSELSGQSVPTQSSPTLKIKIDISVSSS